MMNLDQLFNSAKDNLEAARQSLVQLTDGLKTTKNTDFAAVMKVATSVAAAEAELAKLAQKWVEQATQTESVYDDSDFLRERLIYNDPWRSEEQLSRETTFEFDRFLHGVEERE